MKRIAFALALLGLVWPCHAGFDSGNINSSIGFSTAKASSAPYQGPNDVQSGAVIWWGFRALSASVAGTTANVADLVASTGGAAVCTLKLATNGNADMTTAYCNGNTQTVGAACLAASGGSCKVTKLYDQTGNGRPLTQATLANMPAFVTSAQNGHPGMTFSGGQYMTTATALTQAQPIVVSYVLKASNTAEQASWLINDNGTFQFGSDRLAANNAFIYAGTSAPTATMADASFHAAQLTYDNGGSTSQFYIDGTATSASLSNSSAFSAQDMTIGAGFAGSWQFATGTWEEAGIWSGTWTSGTKSSMNSNQHSYWGF